MSYVTLSFRAEFLFAALTKRAWCYILCLLVNLVHTLRLAVLSESSGKAAVRGDIVLVFGLYLATWQHHKQVGV